MITDILNTQLLSQLECPVCFETCVAPIYMCTNGHSVCATCQPQLNECSTCRAPGKPTLRSVQLEKIAALVKTPCTNHPHGCQLIFSMDEMAKHLPKCVYGFQCHLCKEWKGCAKAMKHHVQEEHSSFFFQCSSSGSINLTTMKPTKKEYQDKEYFNLFCSADDNIFWLVDKFNSKNRIFSRILRVVSHDPEVASRYYYNVEFKSKGAKNKSRVFQQADVLTEGAYIGGIDIVLPVSLIDSYADGYIAYTFTILMNS